MLLICEKVEDIKVLKETAESGKKNYFIEGVFLQSELKNRNGRLYPKSVMEREVIRYTKNNIANGRAYGELNHPDGPSINLDRVSHLIVDLRKEGTNYIGLGTNLKYFIEKGGGYNDITPIIQTDTLTNPFATTLGSSIVTVTDANYQPSAGDFVIFSGASAVDTSTPTKPVIFAGFAGGCTGDGVNTCDSCSGEVNSTSKLCAIAPYAARAHR